MGTINRLPISTVNPNDLALLAEDPDYFLAAKSGRLYRVDGEPIIGDAEAAATRAEAAADAAEAALAVIEAQAYRDPSSATIVAGQSDYPLGYEPGEDRLDVSLNGSVLLHGTDYSIVDGDTLRLLDASYYAQAGGTLVWKGGAQMPYSPETLPHFDTFAAFSAANVEPPLNTASIAGQLVVADATGPIQAANLRKWAPAGGRFDIRLAATASALASDFGGIASQWMLDCATRGWIGVIGPSDDPYEWNRITVDIANDLRLDLTGANLYPKTDFNDFTCDGTVNSFTLGSWFSGNLSDCSSVYITGDRTYTGALTNPATEFEVVSGNTIRRIAGAPASGRTLRIGNRWQAWRITSSNRSRVWLRGGYMDLGRRGYVPTRASGSGYGFQSTGPVYWDGAPVVTNSGGDFTGTLLAQRSDSAIVFNDVQTKYVEGLIAQGMGDLAIYDTGGADTLSGADDGFGLNIIGGDFYRCTNGVKMVRQGASMNMTGTNMRQCVTGIVNSDIGASDAGRNFIIHAHFFDIARRALDLRNTDSLRGRVTIEDWGYLPNGTGWTNQSGTDDSTAISLSDCLGVSLDVEIHNRTRTKKASRPAIQVASGTAQGNRITATIRNASTGLRETGGDGSTEFGGRYELTCVDVDTPFVLSLASNSRVTVSHLTGTPVSGERVISNHPTGMTRADAVAAHAQGLRIPNGRVIDIEGLLYRGVTGSTNISDLPGLVPIDPEPGHYGISADGATDIGAALTKAFEVADTVYIPEIVGSSWAVSTPILMGPKKKLVGRNPIRSRIKDLTGGTVPLISYVGYTDPSSAGPDECEVRDIFIDSLSVTDRTTYWTIHLPNAEDVKVIGVTINAAIGSSKPLTALVGIHTGKNPAGSFAGNAWLCRVEGCRLYQAKVFCNATDGWVIGNELYGYFCDYACRLGGGNIFEGNHFGGGVTYGGLYLHSPEGNTIFAVKCVGNHYDGNNTNESRRAVFAPADQLVASCVISGNHGWNVSEEFVRLENAQACNISANVWRQGDIRAQGFPDIYVSGGGNNIGQNTHRRLTTHAKPTFGVRAVVGVPAVVIDVDGDNPSTIEEPVVWGLVPGAWLTKSVRTGAVIPERRVALMEDFLTTNSVTNVFDTAKGSNATAALLALAAAQDGVGRLQFGVDAGGTMALNGSQLMTPAVWRAFDYDLELHARIRPQVAVHQKWFLGFTNGVGLHLPITENAGTYTANVAEGVGFLYSARTTAASLVGIGVKASTLTAASTLLTVAGNTWYDLRLELSQGGRASFAVNGSVLAYMVANAVTATTLMSAYVGGHSSNNGNKYLDVDFLRITKRRLA